MSKKTKTKNQLKRRRDKAARKEKQRDKYEKFMERGINTKSKRAQAKVARRKVVRNGRHLKGPCGNAGCKRCYQHNMNAWARKKARRVVVLV